MSDFRRFSIVLFISIGLLCALANHTDFKPRDGAAGIVMAALFLAAIFVAFFGRQA